MRILVVYEHDGDCRCGLWDSWSSCSRDLWSPSKTVVFAYDFSARGRSYRDRKEFVESHAVEWSNWIGQTDNDLSYEEWAIINSCFEHVGRQYGLLRDFRENCIC